MGGWSEFSACIVRQGVRLYSVVEIVVMSGEVACCSVVCGTLVGVSVFSVMCGCMNGASPVRFVLSLLYMWAFQINPVCVVCVVTSD